MSFDDDKKYIGNTKKFFGSITLYGGETESYFPREIKQIKQSSKIPKIKEEDNIIDWFYNIVNKLPEQDPTLFTVEPNIAIVLEIKHSPIKSHTGKNCEISQLNCHALIFKPQKDIKDIQKLYNVYEDLISSRNTEISMSDLTDMIQYIRLDYHPNELGDLFSHPLPHIHIDPKGGLRFPFPVSQTGHIIENFIEFLYLNYSYKDWINWAEWVWHETFDKEEKDLEKEGKKTKFNEIKDLYKQGDIKLFHMQDNPSLIHTLSSLLEIEKSALTRFKIPDVYKNINYHQMCFELLR